MKLRNKKSGEIIDLYEGLIRDDGEHITIKPVAVLEKCYIYNSLAELNAEWEDYEASKEYWFINPEGEVNSINEADDSPEGIKASKQIGNYFETKEEAEQAVEKLKAWKRLEDKGFKLGMDLSGVYGTMMIYGIKITASEYDELDETRDDLDLLFGGEEWCTIL